eukprot:scaffold11482_cov26-Phaeocystis_antarctica.AAC.1
MSAYLTTYYLLLTRCASPQGALVVATTTSYHLPPLTRYVSTSRRPSACRWISARCASVGAPDQGAVCPRTAAVGCLAADAALHACAGTTYYQLYYH